MHGDHLARFISTFYNARLQQTTVAWHVPDDQWRQIWMMDVSKQGIGVRQLNSRFQGSRRLIPIDKTVLQPCSQWGVIQGISALMVMLESLYQSAQDLSNWHFVNIGSNRPYMDMFWTCSLQSGCRRRLIRWEVDTHLSQRRTETCSDC